MRRPLVIGLDDYPDHPLGGCVNDTLRIEAILSLHHDNRLNFNCETITSPPLTVTRPILRLHIFELFKHPAEIAFLHFSGHCTVNGLGCYLVTPDHCEYDVWIPMTEILAIANQSPVNDIFIKLYCCHSGEFGVLPEVSSNKIIFADGISVIIATRFDQEAIEEEGGGFFTSLLIEALEGGAASLLGEVFAASIYAYVDNAMGAWDQHPQFKASVDAEHLYFAEIQPKARKLTMLGSYYCRLVDEVII